MTARAKKITPKGRRVRESVLQRSVEIAVRDGLEAVSFGRLAKDLGTSKSGLFSHFANKLELQLATVDFAEQRFVARVYGPDLTTAPRGLPRLWALCEAWLTYAEDAAAQGGCFFQALVAEYHNRSGPLRERAKQGVELFNDGLQRAIEGAKAAGHLRADVDTVGLAFILHSLMGGANGGFQLFRDPDVFAVCRRLLAEQIRQACTDAAPAIPDREG